MNHFLKKIVFVVCILSTMLSANNVKTKYYQLHTNYKLVILDVPHFYEFNHNENPNGYYWCGQTALKSIIYAETDWQESPSLEEIHKLFLKNKNNKPKTDYYKDNCGDGNYWCAYVNDLIKAIPNYGLNAVRESFSSKEKFYKYVKNSLITNKNPVIVLSNNYYRTDLKRWLNIGHYYIINGFYEDKTNKILIFRDVAIETVNEKMDKIGIDILFSLDNFWNNAFSWKSKLINGKREYYKKATTIKAY